MKDFSKFLSELKPTNAKLDYFVDFDKVEKNIKGIEIKLNQLNYLIGKSNLKEAIKDLYEESPKAFEILDILIAVRDGDKASVICQKEGFRSLKSYFKDIEEIEFYIKETGLEKILGDKKIKNLVDYVFGIEVGLDTNARKNRGGKNMASIIKEMFSKEGIIFKEEVSSNAYSSLKTLGVDIKIFDYVIEKNNKKYVIEVNFYSSGGSKLNEVARAYTDISKKINSLEDFEFVWITDGIGWNTAKNKLEEAYNNIERVYNLTTLSEFIKELKQ